VRCRGSIAYPDLSRSLAFSAESEAQTDMQLPNSIKN
jgi:hypothetical protein